MKKILITILVVMLCLSHGSYAESLSDIANWTDADLLATRDILDDEIFKRGIEFETEFYPGVYVVGEDIKAGQYDIIVHESDSLVFIVVYANKDDYIAQENHIIWENLSAGTTGYHVSLSDGMVLNVIDNDAVSMTIKHLKSPFMP